MNKKWSSQPNNQNMYPSPQQNIQTNSPKNNSSQLIKKNGCNCGQKRSY